MLLPLFGLALSVAQDASLVHSTFAAGEDGWVAVQTVGAGGKVAAVHDAPSLKVGSGSLNYSYGIGAGQMSNAVLPVAEGTAAKLASIHFWVRSESNVPLSVTLQEKGGSQFNAMVSVPKGKWQEVEVGLSDFTESNDPGSTPDANGKLDADKIDSVALFDLSQFVAQIPALASLLGVKDGNRSFLISDFQLTTKPLPETNPATASEYVFDTFARPQPAWPILHANGAVLEAAPLFTRALRLDYNLSSGEAAAAFKRIQPGVLTGKKTLNLRLASSHSCQLIVQLEEKTGGKYNALLAIPGGPDPIDKTIELSTMTADQDTKDANGKLDLDQVKQLTFVDITAIAEAPGMNVLWIGKVSAKS